MATANHIRFYGFESQKIRLSKLDWDIVEWCFLLVKLTSKIAHLHVSPSASEYSPVHGDAI